MRRQRHALTPRCGRCVPLTGQRWPNKPRQSCVALSSSPFCREHDLVDTVTLLIATGLRRSELLALRWKDFDAEAGTLTVAEKLVRATGHGLSRIDETKTAAGKQTLPLSSFAVIMLKARRTVSYYGEQPMIFPSTAGTWRDPNDFGKEWRKVRKALGVPGSPHSRSVRRLRP